MKPTNRLASLMLAIIAWLVLGTGACAGDDPDSAAPDDQPAYGGTLVIGGHTDLQGANPLTVNQAYPMEILQHVLLMTLLRFDEELHPVPYLARSWEVHGDTAVTFHLREDVYWHDGERTTAHDVAFTYERATDPETGFVNRVEYFSEWGDHQVVDSFTIRFRIEPHSEFLAGWAQLAIAPRHVLEDVPPAQLHQAAYGRNPVGNGPFRFVSQSANDRWVFEANPDFPEGLGGRPLVDRLVWRVIPETASRMAEIRTGAVHLITNPPREQAGALATEQPRLRLIERPTRIFSFIGWNGLREPFDDPRVRRALTMAIDRQGIIDGLRAGSGTLALGPVGPFHWAYADTLQLVPYDPDGARAILLEAGFEEGRAGVLLRDGRPFTFALSVVAADQFNSDAAEKIRSDLARIGVRMRTELLEPVTLFDRISSAERRFDAALIGLESGFRLDLRPQFHSDELGGGFQLASYSNPEVDSLLTLANLETQPELAAPLWHELQRIMVEEQPWTVLYYTPELFVVDERVRGVEMDIRGRFQSLPRWWLSEGT